MKLFTLYILIASWLTGIQYSECNSTIDPTSSLVAEQLGFITEKIGKMTITNSDTLISVIIKLPNITQHMAFDSREVFNAHVCQYSNGLDKQARITLKKLESNWTTIANNYINSRREVLRPYILHDNHGPAKRQALIMAGVGLATLVFGGISEYQIHEVNNHVKNVQQDILKVSKALSQYHEQMVVLKNDLIGLIKADVDKLKNYIENNSCKNCIQSAQDRREFDFKRISELIDSILSGPLEGKNELTLTPNIIRPETLKLIVKQHSLLNRTIFHSDPYLLYSMAKINLVSIGESFTNAHFVMRIPIVKNDAAIYNLYYTKQVGIFIKNNTCRYFKLPKYVYENGKHFYTVNMEECKQHNSLYICPTFNMINMTACLQRDSWKCQAVLSECKSPCEIRTSSSGILFRDQPDNKSYITDNEGWTHNVKLSETRTKFISWENISSAQICDTKVETPSTHFPALPVFDLPVEINSLEIMDPQELSIEIAKLTRKYNTSLNHVLEPIFDDDNHREFKDIAIVINSVLIISLFILTINIYCILNVSKCHSCLSVTSCCVKRQANLTRDKTTGTDELHDRITDTKLDCTSVRSRSNSA